MAKRTKDARDEVIRVLKRLRRRGVTLETISGHCGVALATVARWARGDNRPSPVLAAHVLPSIQQLDK